MSHRSPLSPEARAERGYHERRGRPVWERAWSVTKRVFVGIFANGFMYAGNLAYLALMTVFPFFILAAAIASVFGQRGETVRAVNSFLYTLPPSAGELLRKPISDVLAARTGSLLLLGAVIALWTVGSFDLTYGSLAGVIVTLLFFWIIGFGISIGAHLNAALAETPVDDVREGETSREAVAT